MKKRDISYILVLYNKTTKCRIVIVVMETLPSICSVITHLIDYHPLLISLLLSPLVWRPISIILDLID